MNTNIPVKIMRVEDFMQIAVATTTIASINRFNSQTHAELSKFYTLLLNYEKETSQILERKHFVCEVEKPDSKKFIDDTDFAYAWKDYESAQSQLVFEGFEEYASNSVGNDRMQIWFPDAIASIGGVLYPIPTLYDFIYHISKYNETATQKINLKFTETWKKRIVG